MQRVCICLILGALLVAKLDAQDRASISGFARDGADGEVLIGANVYLEGQRLGSTTNASGYYVIPRVPPGDYVLACAFIGYQTLRRPVRLGAGENLKVDLVLVEEVLQGEETVVRADSMATAEQLFARTLSEVQLTARQIKSIPQVAEADLLRSLQTLPGILPLSDFSSALYVRGGTPDQNLYMIDGTDVYNPEHAFGIFSTFNTDAIKQVEVSKGGFGAEYGGRLSSILHVTNLDGNREEFEGTAAISLLSAKTTLQMPLGRRGSLSGSVRRTYFDQTVGRQLDEVPDYYFYDGNFKAFLDLSERDKLTLSFYGGRDFLDVVFNQDASQGTGFRTDWGNETGNLRWTRVFSPRLFANFWVTGSRFSSNFHFEEAEVRERNRVADLSVKGDLEYHHSRHFEARFGFEQKRLRVRFGQVFPAGEVDIHSRPEHFAFYGRGRWRPGLRWDLQAGLRYNLFDVGRAFQHLDPRLAIKYRLSEKSSLKMAAGIYHQYLHRVPRFIATDIWTTSNEFQDASLSRHLIGGYQREWARNYQVEVEAFYKDYGNIYDFNQTFLTELEETGYNEKEQPVFTSTRGIFKRGEGRSIGFEVLVRKDVGALSGWAGYSLASTRYEFPGINQDRSFAPRHDRTSTLNLVANIDVGNAWRQIEGREKVRHQRSRWTLGANFVYSTGQPFTEPGSGYIVGVSPGDPDRNVVYAPTRINNVRLPYYSRLDLSLTWERQFGGWSMAPYLQIFNIGNRRNVWFIDYEFNNGIPKVDEQYMFPLLPTLGVNFRF